MDWFTFGAILLLGFVLGLTLSSGVLGLLSWPVIVLCWMVFIVGYLANIIGVKKNARD